MDAIPALRSTADAAALRPGMQAGKDAHKGAQLQQHGRKSMRARALRPARPLASRKALCKTHRAVATTRITSTAIKKRCHEPRRDFIDVCLFEDLAVDARAGAH
jgi:hypothetical protein